MGTRSSIGIENADGSVTAIYCHWDGYPSYNGRMLKDHYTDEAKVRELVALGDISSLDAEIGTKHDFDNAPKGECNAYGRDRGETGIESQDFVSAADYYNRFGAGTEYAYLFREGSWLVRSTYNDRGWLAVADYLLTENEEA